MKRADGRKADEIRPIVMEAGVIPNAKGSAMVRMGNTVAVAAVYGPREMHPKHKQISDRANLNTIYAMVPFSCTDRIRPGYSRRSQEICKVTRQALEPAVFLEDYPKAAIDVYINIISANAGTRTAGINAASLALADAGIPMRDLVASVATGKIGNDYVMDLAGKEEEETVCDLPVAYMPKSKQITLLQMDGDLSPEDVKKVMELAIKGCEKIYKMQKEALKKRWIK
ncbi:MAG: exosome complex exonuclease Rrp41 [Candidatus Aenigmarchaeota archaeon]